MYGVDGVQSPVTMVCVCVCVGGGGGVLSQILDLSKTCSSPFFNCCNENATNIESRCEFTNAAHVTESLENTGDHKSNSGVDVV